MKNLLLPCLLCFTLTFIGQTSNDGEITSQTQTPERISVLWDASLNTGDRKVSEEIELLRSYIKGLASVNVVVSKFRNGVFDQKEFDCSGECTNLFEYLDKTQYNGASNYSGLIDQNASKSDLAIVFTDGMSVFEPLDSTLKIPVLVVNSRRNAAHQYLAEFSAATQGGYVDLSRLSKQEGLNVLNFVPNDSAEKTTLQQQDPLYYGVVYNEDKTPIQGALVRIKNSFTEVRTENNGRYKIAAKEGDVLEISALGMITKDTVLTRSKKTHIPLKADGELLDEVLVQQKKVTEEKVDEAFGNQKKAAVGYSLGQKFTSKDIQPYHTTLAQVLIRMPGVVVEGVDGINEKYVFRKTQNASFLNGGKTYPAIILDGLLIDQATQRVPFIDPLTIESITLLKSALSTVRYGQLAAYGAIVIELKDYDNGDAPVRQNTALVRGNDYDENPPLLENAFAALPKPNYLSVLERSTSFEEARTTYYKQLRNEKNNLEFYLRAASYFERWNAEFSLDILSNIAVVASQNVKALKVLAYRFEEQGALERARYVYEQLVNLRPQDVQSYRDLAQAYVATGEYELAATLYRQMLFNTIPNVDFEPVEDIVIHEFRNLIMKHKSRINYQGLPNSLLAIDFEIDIRLMLEWNHPGAEFDVQVVSPEKKYFSYSHTAFNNKELLQQEMDNGFFMKEFVVDEGEKGSWIVNIRHSGGHNDQVPLLLKYTQFKNYGTPKETRTVKVIQLDKFQDKVTLDLFVN
ncbi:MAG: carboxypeptidase-like regulatory domain-containing protein [Bacteroidota bacterium]